MKLPAALTRRFRRKPAPPRRAVQTTLNATAAARRGDLDDYDSPEPTTSLSAAFIIVFLLHVVAVVGIYIFNHIKSTRPVTPVKVTATAKTKTAPPKAAATETAKPAATAPTAAPKQQLPSGPRIHRVQSNENLTRIATLYAVTLADLEAANDLNAKSVLQVDQVLNIPPVRNVVRQPAPALPKIEPAPKPTLQPIALKAATPTKPAPAKPATPKPVAKTELKTYTVDKGDTVTYIAKRYGVSSEALIKLNGITQPTKLQAGRKLRIPAKN
jgi:N-acetylmuramoyl-L-alanine amidase